MPRTAKALLRLEACPGPGALRWLLALLLVFAAGPAHTKVTSLEVDRIRQEIADHSERAFKVLLIGNSHTRIHDVRSRLARQLATRIGPHRIPVVGRITRDGARLYDVAGRKHIIAAIRMTDWDALVVQEASASFLYPTGREAFHRALGWFVENTPASTSLILFQTWPWIERHRLYRGTLPATYERPKNAQEMWAWMTTHFDAALKRHGVSITLAPVGHCWQETRPDLFYSRDGNHATRIGAEYTSIVLAETIVRAMASERDTAVAIRDATLRATACPAPPHKKSDR